MNAPVAVAVAKYALFGVVSPRMVGLANKSVSSFGVTILESGMRPPGAVSTEVSSMVPIMPPVTESPVMMAKYPSEVCPASPTWPTKLTLAVQVWKVASLGVEGSDRDRCLEHLGEHLGGHNLVVGGRCRAAVHVGLDRERAACDGGRGDVVEVRVEGEPGVTDLRVDLLRREDGERAVLVAVAPIGPGDARYVKSDAGVTTLLLAGVSPKSSGAIAITSPAITCAVSVATVASLKVEPSPRVP